MHTYTRSCIHPRARTHSHRQRSGSNCGGTSSPYQEPEGVRGGHWGEEDNSCTRIQRKTNVDTWILLFLVLLFLLLHRRRRRRCYLLLLRLFLRLLLRLLLLLLFADTSTSPATLIGILIRVLNIRGWMVLRRQQMHEPQMQQQTTNSLPPPLPPSTHTPDAPTASHHGSSEELYSDNRLQERLGCYQQESKGQCEVGRPKRSTRMFSKAIGACVLGD